jgi:hypothetical protein
MRRKILVSLMAVAMMAAMTGCGNKTDSTEDSQVSVKNDLVEFVGTEIPEVEAKEVQVMDAYNAYFAEDSTVDTDKLQQDLSDNLIPTYKEFLDDTEAIEVATDEVKELKTLYLDAMNTQYQALLKVQSAIENNDTDIQDEAKDLITQANDKYTQYNDAVYELAQKENVTLEGEMSTSAATEEAAADEDSAADTSDDASQTDDNASEADSAENTDSSEDAQ